MKYSEVQLSSLYFPKTEWMWLRPFKNASPSADEFFWAWKNTKTNQTYSWNNEGLGCQFGTKTDSTIHVLEFDSKETPSELDAFCFWVKRAFQSEQALDVEWVAVLKTLTEHFNFSLTENKIPQSLKESLISSGLEPHLGILAQRAKFHFLNLEELRFLFSKRWSPEVFELLEIFPQKIRAATLSKIQELGLSAQHTKEALTFILTIYKKLNEQAALSLLTNTFASAEDFRISLFRTAQPELYAMSEERIQKLRALKAPPRTSVYGDPSFEQDSIKITHTPRNMTDLELFKTWVDGEQFIEKFKDLLDIYRQ